MQVRIRQVLIVSGAMLTFVLLGERLAQARATDGLVLRAGYRHLHIDYHGDVILLNTALSGPILGATFRF